MSKIIVNKIGGGILVDKYLPLIPLRIQTQIKNGYTPILVVSAFPGITDDILFFAKQIKENQKINESIYIKSILSKHTKIIDSFIIDTKIKNQTLNQLDELFLKFEKDIKLFIDNKKNTDKSPIYEDALVAYGERFAATIIAKFLENKDMVTKRVLAEDIPIITDDNFKDANIIKDISTKNLNSYFTKKIKNNSNSVLIIPGFTGKTKAGATTTLGRGGTDTAACFIGSALKVKKIILWKNVGGVMSCDPRLVNNVKKISKISYDQAIEAGKIIHEKAIDYVKNSKTPIEITSIENPKHSTTIKDIRTKESGAKIISLKRNAQLFLINDETLGISELISFTGNIFSKYKTEIVLISNTRYGLQVVAYDENDSIESIKREISNKVQKVEKTVCDMIFMVGQFNPNDVSDFNNLLIKQDVDLNISAFYYQNCTRIEAVIKTKNIEKVVNAVHGKFIK